MRHISSRAALTAALAGAVASSGLAVSPAVAEDGTSQDADTTPPVVTAQFTRQGVVLTATDEGSGVDRIEYGHASHVGTDTLWITYTGPLRPWAYDTPGHFTYRAIDKAGNLSPVGVAPGEQHTDFTWTASKGNHGRPIVVSVRPTLPAAVTDKNVGITASVWVGGDQTQYRAKVVDGVAEVKLPARLAAGTHRISVHVAVDHPWVYSLLQVGKVKVAKAASRTKLLGAKPAKKASVKVKVSSTAGVKTPGKVTAKVTRVIKGKRVVVATRKATLSAKGTATVKLPKSVRSKKGRYTLVVKHSGSDNVAKSSSKKITWRVR